MTATLSLTSDSRKRKKKQKQHGHFDLLTAFLPLSGSFSWLEKSVLLLLLLLLSLHYIHTRPISFVHSFVCWPRSCIRGTDGNWPTPLDGQPDKLLPADLLLLLLLLAARLTDLLNAGRRRWLLSNLLSFSLFLSFVRYPSSICGQKERSKQASSFGDLTGE